MELPFDIYAMTQPKSREDMLLLVREARQELRNINDLLDSTFAECLSPEDA